MAKGNYARRKGHNYETQIAKELREIGYECVVTSRSESKSMDDNKVDLVDTCGKLPVYIQLKKTVNTPNYFEIKSQCSLTDKPLCLMWNKQLKKNKNFSSVGELVMIPKDFFYQLLTVFTEAAEKTE